ncbi:MAG: hypothetical protein E6K82_06340 [Candidatus Rokuibacteriota bacterium]|nr:MAG: hypothetical protein E6K82_06340 [Candidatus Rokubacteria bacterium]
MVTRALGAIMTVGMLSASAAWAGNLTDALESDRMTVVKVDKATGGVLLRNGVSVNWLEAPGAMIVAPHATKRDLGLLNTGDIVRVRRDGAAPTIIILRSAADEIGSLE